MNRKGEKHHVIKLLKVCMSGYFKSGLRYEVKRQSKVAVAARSTPGDLVNRTSDESATVVVDLLCRGNVVNVVAEGDKKVKEKLSTAVEHFQLHRAAALKSASTADDEGEIVSPQLRVRVWRVGVGIAC
jgi:hypothetical protein